MTTSILKAKIKPPTRYVKYIGLLTIEWAKLEMGIDVLVEIAFARHNPETIGEKFRPHTLDRKLTFLKKAFKRLPAYMPFGDTALLLLRRVGELSTQRHELTHGHVDKHLSSGDVVLTLLKISPERTMGQQRIVRVKQIEDLILKVEALGGEFLELWFEMFDAEAMLELLLSIPAGSLEATSRQLRRISLQSDQIERETRQSRAKARRELASKKPRK